MTDIVIASAARTAVGAFGGSFAKTPAHDMGLQCFQRWLRALA